MAKAKTAIGIKLIRFKRVLSKRVAGYRIFTGTGRIASKTWIRNPMPWPFN